jgi:hypothetical protein
MVRANLQRLLFVSTFLAMFCFPAATAAQKLTPEEVVAKHLASLGTPEKRAAIHSRVLEGQARLDLVTRGGAPFAGEVRLFSDGHKYRVALEFLRQNYWGEQFMTDGDKVEVGFVIPSRRSQLGEFLSRFPEIVREGLPGGALTMAWPLLNLQEHQPTLEYDGLKKVEKRQLHRLTYKMKKGGGPLTIHLFFEQDTFRHVRTYIQWVEASGLPATPSQTASRSETRFTLEEEFSEFVKIEGLTLPTMWTIRMTGERGGSIGVLPLPEVGAGNSVFRWRAVFEKLFHNVKIKPEEMAIEPPGRIAAPKEPKPLG